MVDLRVGTARRPRPRQATLGWALVAGSVAMFLVGFLGVRALLPESLALSGVHEGEIVHRGAARRLQLLLTGHGARSADVRVDGQAVETAPHDQGAMVDLRGLPVGPHTVEVRGDGRVPWQEDSITRQFTVDAAGPAVYAPAQIGIPPGSAGVVLSGMVDGATSLTVAGTPAPIDRGRFDVMLPPTPSVVTVRAADDQGRFDETSVVVTDQEAAPRHVGFRSVHMRSADWADPTAREAVLDLARRGLIDAVQLDIKDEGGTIGYQSNVPLAREIGAVTDHYDPAEALGTLRDLGVRVVGRIVNFRDPVLGRWALDHGKLDYLVLNGDGTAPYDSEYGDAAFTNPANPDVRRYNIDLAVEAVQLGFDDILYDYVRRPDGDFDTMSFPGITTRSEVAVAEFVRLTSEALDRTGRDVGLGVSVFGIAATRPNQIAQDVLLLAPWVDFISPMLYPSLWNAGEYGVDRPSANPYEIISRSMVDFNRAVLGTGTVLIPWLQDFSLSGGVPYGPAEVDAQIRAALEQGAAGFLMWNAESRYHGEGLVPSAPGDG